MKPKKILLLAIFSGFLTTGVFYIFMQQNTTAEVEQPVMVQVVSAAVDIGENVQLTEENLQMIEMRESEVHSAAIKDKDEALGEYTSTELVTGEVLLGHHIEQQAQADILSKKLAYGYRAVSFEVDYPQSVSNMVEPNDRVDIVHSQTDETNEHGLGSAEILFEDIKILAVNQRMKETAEGEAIEEYIAVTVEMEQADAVEIVDASGRGPLHLLLISRLKENGEVIDMEIEGIEGKTKNEEVTEVAAQADEETTDATGKSTSADIIVLPERALVRNGPSLNAHVLTVAEVGDELVTKNEEQADEDGRIWMHVETKSGQQGWISSRIIKLDNE